MAEFDTETYTHAVQLVYQQRGLSLHASQPSAPTALLAAAFQHVSPYTTFPAAAVSTATPADGERRQHRQPLLATCSAGVPAKCLQSVQQTCPPSAFNRFSRRAPPSAFNRFSRRAPPPNDFNRFSRRAPQVPSIGSAGVPPKCLQSVQQMCHPSAFNRFSRRAPPQMPSIGSADVPPKCLQSVQQTCPPPSAFNRFSRRATQVPSIGSAAALRHQLQQQTCCKSRAQVLH